MSVFGTATTRGPSQQFFSRLVRASRAAAIVLLCAGGAAGCQDPVAECETRFRRDEHEQALASCTRAFLDRGDPEAAVRAAGAAYYLERADEVRAWAERMRGHPREAGVLFYLGRSQLDAGDDAALATHQRAVDIAHRHHDLDGVARNAFMLYDHAWRRGEYATALPRAYESFAAARSAGDRAGESRAVKAMAQILFELGDLEGTRRALAHLRHIGDPGDQSLQSHILQKQGSVYVAEGRLALARDAFARALAAAETAGDKRLQRDNLLNLASVSIELGDSAAARHHLDAIHAFDAAYDARATPLFRARLALLEGRLDDAGRALTQARAQTDNVDWLWKIELEAGHVAEQQGEAGAAAAAYERAIATVEDMRASLDSNELKAWILASQRRPYEALFRLHARRGQTLDALGVLDRARARSLLDAFVARGEAGQRAGASGDLGAGGSDPPPWIGHAVDHADALASLLPAMSTSPVSRPRPVHEVVQALGPRTALLYFRTDDALWLLRVQDGRIDVVELASGKEDLRALDALVDRVARAPGDAGAAAALGQRLLPATLLPAPGTPLYLVPDGSLMRLPFAALRLEDRHLIERHVLVYLPGLSALAAIEGATPPAAPPAVLGDPRGDLPEAAREVALVAERLGVAPRIGAAATADVLRSAAGARVLHLATHVEVGPRGAALILADGAVDSAQVVNWRLGPALAVLAGCASAVQLSNHHEVWGSLATAFLASGARQVVAALWSIPDQETRAFIERFYAEDGVHDPAGALARVQRAWIATDRSPDAWAAFVLLGTAVAGAPASRTSVR
jgi:tetratricopeptide (TPR) repeat protein